MANPPQFHALLEPVRTSLSRELATPVDRVSVAEPRQRAYSQVWVLETQHDKRFILKWAPGKVRRELELTRLTQKLFADNPQVMTPRICCCPTPHTFLVEQIPGKTLDAFCARPLVSRYKTWLSQVTPVLHRLGAWLRQFHSADRRQETLAPEGLRSYVCARQPALDEIGETLANRLLALIDSAKICETVRLHGDFTPHNVLVREGAIGVVDFSGVTDLDRGTHFVDLAWMVTDLEDNWRRSVHNFVWRSSASANPLVQAFIEGYGVEDMKDPLFRACRAVRHLVKIYSSRLRSGSDRREAGWHRQAIRELIAQ